LSPLTENKRIRDRKRRERLPEIPRDVRRERLREIERDMKYWQRRLKVLRLLARRGPLNKYGICRDLVPKEASEPTILYLVDEMEQDGLIKVVNTIKKVRGSKPSKYYDLALHGLAGLVVHLGETESDRQFLSHLARKYRDLMPSIFDAWPAILQGGVEDVAVERLDLLCSLLLSGWPMRQAIHTEVDIVEKDGVLSEDAADLFLDPLDCSLDLEDGRPPAAAERWLEAVRSNGSLRQATIGPLRRIIEFYQVAGDEVERKLREANELLASLEQANKIDKGA
jgi:DNA-binding PadR family transcriptional regulator